MTAKAETWCDRDEHRLFEYYIDFNEWLDGASTREDFGIDGITVPSKAFYAGDKEAYDQAFQKYRVNRRYEVLNERYLCDQFSDDHWFQRNLDRFGQLVVQLEEGNVVPFIGAGLSVAGGFPSWEDKSVGAASTHFKSGFCRRYPKTRSDSWKGLPSSNSGRGGHPYDAVRCEHSPFRSL